MRNHARIYIWLAVVLAFTIRPGAPLALEQSSARISSLGGDHVAGVIPDLYTDLSINPAYAFFADRLIVSYAKRRVPGYAPSLPYLTENSSAYSGSSMMVNELSAWGIRISSWRAAAVAQWALYQPESNSSYTSIEMSSRYAARMDGAWISVADDFARIDLIAARAIGDRYALGLRLQGWGYYDSSSDMRTYATDYYNDPYFSSIDARYTDTWARSSYGRRLSFDFQAGIVKSNDAGPRTDLSLRASLNQLDHESRTYGLRISKEYDSEGLLDSYRYDRDCWSDNREGDLWNFALMLRHAFDGGIRVLAGGEVSTCSYETRWSSSQELVQWSSDLNETFVGSFDGDGSLLGGSCFIKGGKVFSLHETTDLCVGLHGVLARTRTEEKPLIHFTSESDGEESAVRIDQPSRLESTNTSLKLSLPISVEFRPSSYFTFFSSFILLGGWDKQTTTTPNLSIFRYFPPVAEPVARGANRAAAASQITVEPESYLTDWKRTMTTGSAVNLGFSLHYGERFFVDVYAETEIIPTSLGTRTIDIRYAF